MVLWRLNHREGRGQGVREDTLVLRKTCSLGVLKAKLCAGACQKLGSAAEVTFNRAVTRACRLL